MIHLGTRDKHIKKERQPSALHSCSTWHGNMKGKDNSKRRDQHKLINSIINGINEKALTNNQLDS